MSKRRRITTTAIAVNGKGENFVAESLFMVLILTTENDKSAIC